MKNSIIELPKIDCPKSVKSFLMKIIQMNTATGMTNSRN